MVTSSGLKTNMKIFTLLTALTAVFLSAGYVIGGTGGMIIGLLFAGLMNFGSYWFSDRIVLKIYGAKPLREEYYLDLHLSNWPRRPGYRSPGSTGAPWTP